MIEKARVDDARSIAALVNHYADQELMLPRSQNDVCEKLRDFFVWREAGEVLGCVALHVGWGGLAEIRSLCVAEDAQGRGVGRVLVETCVSEAGQLGVTRLFVLTYVVDFFKKLGFTPCAKESLPHKIWADCLNCPKFPDCDEVALIRDLQPASRDENAG